MKFSSVWKVLRNMAAAKEYPLPESINQDMCSGCGICVAVCPYEALELREQNRKKAAHLITASCQGCGLCGASCPSGAISVNLFEDEEIFAQIETPGA